MLKENMSSLASDQLPPLTILIFPFTKKDFHNYLCKQNLIGLSTVRKPYKAQE
jgi:hypothetical protein